jgi:putative MATE family efflux protein
MQRPSLTEGSIPKALVRIAVPIVLSSVLQTMYQIIDTFWVGRLSADAVAAVSLTFPINFLMIALGGGLPIAGTVLIAQYKGRGDDKAMNHVAAQTFLMVFAVSIVMSVFGYVFSEQIMRLMGTPAEILGDATLYMRVTFVGFVFVFGYFVFESLMRGLGSVRAPMFIVLTTVILNAVLDPLFIFGWGPVPAWGVSGAALATVFTQAVATVIGFVVLLGGKHGLHLKAADFRPDVAFMKKAFFIGFPSSIEQSARAFGFTIMTVLVAGFGTVTLAAYGIGIRALTFIIIPAIGLSIATSALVGQNIGAGKMHRAVETNRIGSIIAFVLLTVAGGLVFLFARPLSAAFIPDGGDAIDQSAQFIRILAPTFGLIGWQMVLTGTMRGAGDTKASMILTIVGQYAVQFPLAYLFAYAMGMGSVGIWWSFAVSNVVTTVVAVAWYARGTWKTKNILGDMDLREKAAAETIADEGVAG